MATSWLLREPLKATAAVNISQGRLGLAAGNREAREHFQTMTQYRGQLLEVMSNFRSQPEAVETAFRNYMSELKGLMVHLRVVSAGQDDHADSKGAAAAASAGAAAEHEKPSDEALLKRARQAITWKWSDNTSAIVNEKADYTFEANNMTINFGMWFMKHAAAVADYAAPQTDTDETAKEVFNSLRRAAGIFQYLLNQHRAELAYMPNSDFDERVMEVRVQQCIAEAQEVTLERARSNNHTPSLIAAIARDEHERYLQAADALKSMDNVWAKRLRLFLLFKATFYKAYMYCYTGIQLMTEEKCGEAVRALQEAQKSLQEARQATKAYVRIPIPSGSLGSQAPPDPSLHALFAILDGAIRTNLEKANRENGFIYFHKIPTDAPEPPPPKCLTEPIAFEPPPASTAFDSLKLDFTQIPLKGQNTTADKASGDDAKVKHSPFDPVKPRSATDTGCVVC